MMSLQGAIFLHRHLLYCKYKCHVFLLCIGVLSLLVTLSCECIGVVSPGLVLNGVMLSFWVTPHLRAGGNSAAVTRVLLYFVRAIRKDMMVSAMT